MAVLAERTRVEGRIVVTAENVMEFQTTTAPAAIEARVDVEIEEPNSLRKGIVELHGFAGSPSGTCRGALSCSVVLD